MEVALGVASASAPRRFVAAFGSEALHAGPRLDQGAVDREVLIRQQRAGGNPLKESKP
jgi:hypothetical protein